MNKKQFLLHLKKRKNELEKELNALILAEKAYEKVDAETINDSQLELSIDLRSYRRDKTIKELILEILEKNKTGLTALQILKKIHEGGLPELKRSSLSPQLSRLKEKRIVDFINSVWLLKE